MSTRANITIKDQCGKLFFYRHSDGYPEGTLPTLKQFMQWVKEGKIRDNVNQASGWLILLGAVEYDHSDDLKTFGESKNSLLAEYLPSDSLSGWKVGAYEPTNGLHGDIEYLYIINLETKTLSYSHNWNDEGELIMDSDLIDYMDEDDFKVKDFRGIIKF